MKLYEDLVAGQKKATTPAPKQATQPAAPAASQPAYYGARNYPTAATGQQPQQQNWLQKITSWLSQAAAISPSDQAAMRTQANYAANSFAPTSRQAAANTYYPMANPLPGQLSPVQPVNTPANPMGTPPGQVLPAQAVQGGPTYDPDVVRASMWKLQNSPGISGTLPSIPTDQGSTANIGGGSGYYPYYWGGGGGGGYNYSNGINNWAYGMLTWKR